MANKNNALNYILASKTNIALICIFGMMIGFLSSRAVLSVSTMVFGAIGLLCIHPKKWLQQKWWLAGVVWVGFYALSWFWSSDKVYWSQHFEVKLTFLILPLAFAYLPAFTFKQLRIFTIVTAFILLGGVAYSLSFLVGNMEHYAEQYRIAHVLPTPAENDHIRFSMCIAMFFVWCAYMWPKLHTNALKWFTAIVMLLLAAYLHILAARTGILLLYLFVFAWVLYLALKKSKVMALSVTAVLIGCMILAVTYIPTLNNRYKYMKFTYEVYTHQNDFTGIFSDLGRLLSYKLAYKLIATQPLTGVGAGDMMVEMKKGYAADYPLVAPERQLLPHNQFLIVALAAGLPALAAFLVWLFMPLRHVRKTRDGVFFLLVWALLLLPLLIEPMFEVHFGIFVYLFFLLWQRHALLHPATQ